jgi:uncharacterized protein
MRVVLDTNIFISYLLSHHTGTISKIVEAAFDGSYVLVLPVASLEELVAKMREKEYLAKRISQDDAKQFVKLVVSIAEITPHIDAPLPIVTRDKKDDYLLASALVYRADVLVSGDKDLLDLKSVEGVAMMHPIDFVRLLETKK